MKDCTTLARSEPIRNFYNESRKEKNNIFYLFHCCGAGAGGAEIILRPGAVGAEIILRPGAGTELSLY